jgi:NADH-quinone oxidoreductase subunit K
MIGLPHFLLVSAALFAIGTGLIITRRNAVMVLMGLELVLNAAGINFVAFSRFVPAASEGGRGFLSGDVTVVFLIVLAAAEAAVALAIVLNIYNTFSTIDVDEIDLLKE